MGIVAFHSRYLSAQAGIGDGGKTDEEAVFERDSIYHEYCSSDHDHYDVKKQKARVFMTMALGVPLPLMQTVVTALGCIIL